MLLSFCGVCDNPRPAQECVPAARPVLLKRNNLIWRILELIWASVVLIGLPISSRSLGRRLREAPADRMDLYVSAALSHALLCLPFVVVNVGVSLKRLDPNLTRAAEGLGARPWRVFRTVTRPAIVPGLAGGGAFAFVTSFDEVVISIFIAGYGAKTLPVKLWEQIRVEFTPAAAVGSTLILLLTVALFLMARWAARAGAVAGEGRDR